MKKLNVSQLEGITGGRCTTEGIAFASAVASLSKLAIEGNSSDSVYLGLSMTAAAAEEKWLSCMGWL